MTAELTLMGSAAVRLAERSVRLRRERDRARDLATTLEQQTAEIREAATSWANSEWSELRMAARVCLSILNQDDLQRDRARDLACAYEAQLAKVHALAEQWMARIPHKSGAFYPEASAHDNALDIAYEACADDLREVLEVPDD